MEKKINIENELEMFLDDQLIKEAELLEAELFADDDFEDYQETKEERDASYEKLINRLKADGIYREGENIEKEIKKNVRRKVNRVISRSVAKAAGIMIVSGLCVFAASMTSEANRNYFLHNMRILTGKDTREVADNDVTNEKVDANEYDAIAKIEEELNIEVPEFLYRPGNLTFLSYEINSVFQIARIEYLCDDNVLSFQMDINQEESVSSNSSIIGEEIQNVKTLYDNILVHLGMAEDVNDGKFICYAKWQYNKVNYFLSGRMEMEELKKIIKKMVY